MQRRQGTRQNKLSDAVHHDQFNQFSNSGARDCTGGLLKNGYDLIHPLLDRVGKKEEWL